MEICQARLGLVMQIYTGATGISCIVAEHVYHFGIITWPRQPM